MPRRNNGDNGKLLYQEVGSRIKHARGPRKQQEIADAVGLSRTSITNIEQGRQKILLHTLFEIASALKVAPQELLPDLDQAVPVEGPFTLPTGLESSMKRFVEEAVAKAVSAHTRTRKA